MTNEKENGSSLNYFDRMMGVLHKRPDVIPSRERTIQVVPPFGLGSQAYIIQTYRVKDEGDTIFLQTVAAGESYRIVIPPAVADAIAAQRDQLTGKSRSQASQRVADERKAQGIRPGFMRGKK